MEKIRLLIGNKNYSSWSLRPWILMKEADIPFEEVKILLYDPKFAEVLNSMSPTGMVPSLQHGKCQVWDSLAICEYLAEVFPGKNLWPKDRETRAHARSIANEMHSGFFALRDHLSFNARRRMSTPQLAPVVARHVGRIKDIWSQCRELYSPQGPYLFGHYTIADAMYAPVVLRFRTYGIGLDGHCREYRDHILSSPHIQSWCHEGEAEPSIERYESERPRSE